MRLKRETQGAFCVLNANAKSQNAKIYEDKRDLYCSIVFYNILHDGLIYSCSRQEYTTAP